MEGSEELESRLLTQPWASVCFGESALIAKACFGDTGYVLLLSDLSSVWYESADAEAVGQRSKELNKRLTAHVSSFLHRLANLMSPLLAGQPDSATSFSCQRTAGRLSLRVKSELSGLPFYWDFHCCPAPVEMVCRHLVRPLIRMSLALQYQVQELSFLLRQKDAEIEDYRESGAALSRDRLRTEPFQEKAFLQTFMAGSLPQICGAGDGQAFASALQELYTAVTLQEAKQARKRHRSGEELLDARRGRVGHPLGEPPSPENGSGDLGGGSPPLARVPLCFGPSIPLLPVWVWALPRASLSQPQIASLCSWYQRMPRARRPLQKPRGTPTRHHSPRRTKRRLRAREPRCPPPRCRSPGCPWPRPSRRKRRGSSAERSLPPREDI
uniref:Non-homologous end-joining factor 1 n=1 Tax=Anser brachyrhynchus TaxID=132585 RepID=A0A8B9CYM3_9AVES